MTGAGQKPDASKTEPRGPVGPAILVADSSETFIRYVDLLVKRLGYRVNPARSGEECLKVLENTAVGLILLEDNLPDVGGEELAGRIRGLRKYSRIPIFLVTGDTRKRGGRVPDEKVFAGELKKPINVQALKNALQKHLPFASRRASVRAHIRQKVLIDDGHEQRSLLTLSFGEGGVFVETRAPWPVGTTLEVTLSLPGEKKPLKVKGKVIYTVSGEGMRQRPGMGIHFNRLSKKARVLLAEYMDEYVTDFVP